MSDCMTLKSRTVGEWLERTQAVVAYIKYCSGIFLEGLRRTMKPSLRLAGLKAEIWNQDFLKRQQDSQPFDPKLSVMNVQIKVTDPDITYIGCYVLNRKSNFGDVKYNFVQTSHTVKTALNWYKPLISVGLPVPNFIKSVKNSEVWKCGQTCWLIPHYLCILYMNQILLSVTQIAQDSYSTHARPRFEHRPVYMDLHCTQQHCDQLLPSSAFM